MNKIESILIAIVIITIAILIGGFFYFTLVYNNAQNIKRDEYYATHCKTVNASNVNVNGGTIYQCGNN